MQLCALRYPGRLLAPGEVIPEAMTRFLAAQLGLRPDDLADYAAREETRREHLAALRDVYGYKMFTARGSRDLQAWLDDATETARSNEDLMRSFGEQYRAIQTILPGITLIARLCADALALAERRVDARIAGRLDNEMGNRQDELRAIILFTAFYLDIFRCNLALAFDVIRHRLTLCVQAKAALALVICADPQISDVVHGIISEP